MSLNAFDAVLQNAERLLSDARILEIHNSHRTASSLAILSLEESGKACIIRWKMDGYILRDIHKDIVSGHINKQRVFAALRFADAALETIQEKIFQVGFEKGFERSSIRENMARAGYERAGLHTFYAESGLTDYLKQGGFYTDVGGDLSMPREDYRLSDKDQKAVLDEAQEAIYLARRGGVFQRCAAAVYEVGAASPGNKMSRNDLDAAFELARKQANSKARA